MISNMPNRGVFLVSGATCLLLAIVYHACDLYLHSSDASSIQETIVRYGYSGQDGSRHVYGSPDLLSEQLKNEFEVRMSSKASEDLTPVVTNNREEGMYEIEAMGDAIYIDEQEHKDNGKDQYVVVFDAGSTGTRLHIYHFHLLKAGMKLLSEGFWKTNPGLSEFVHHPEEAVANLQPLIDIAVEKVPLLEQTTTPLVFKATAGFRLLSSSGARGLLDKVREQMASTGFSFSPSDIGIMEDTDEGLFGWITVNFLLGNLSPSSHLTAAALDLGGASMQFTLELRKSNSLAEPVEQVQLLGKTYSVYTHSYLGMGMYAARNSTLHDSHDGVLANPCLPVGYSGSFHFAGTAYDVRGPSAPSKDRCWQAVGRFLSSQKLSPVWPIIESGNNPAVYLFSYFYDTLLWAGVIDSETEKIVTVHDFYRAANKACTEAGGDPKRPFLCQDLTYVTRLLGEVFMLWEKPLHVVSEINSREASWALGAAVDALMAVTHSK